MSDTNIGITISADTARFNSDIAGAASATRQSFDAMRAAAQALANDTAVVDSQTKGYSKSLMAMMAPVTAGTAALKETAKAAGGLSIGTAGATREIIVLANEAMSGRFSRIPGSMMVLTERMGGIGLGALGAIGGVAALGYAFVQLAEQALQADAAVRSVAATMALRNVEIGKEKIADFVDQIHKMPGASYEDAQKVVAAFGSMKNAGGASIQFLIDLVPLFAAAMGETMPAAATRLAEAFGDPIKKGDEFLRTLGALPATVNAFDAATSSGDKVHAYSIMLNEAVAATNRVESATGLATARLKAQRTIFDGLANSSNALAGAEVNMAEVVERTAKATKEIDTDRIAKVAKDMSAASSEAGNAPASGAPLDAMREQLAEYASAHDATQAEILQNEVSTWQQRIAIGDLYGKDLISAESSLARATTALRRETGQEAISNTRDSIAAENAEGVRGRSETLQAEAAAWKALLSGDQLTATQRIATQRQLNATLAQLHGVEQQSVVRGVTLQLAADQDYFAQKSAHIQELFDLGQMSATKEAAQLKQVANEEFAQLQRDYQEKLQFESQDVQAQSQTYAELERLTAQHNARIGQLNAQSAKALKANYNAAFQPITTAFDGMVSGMLRGTLTFQQATQNVLQNIVVSYAEMGVKAAIQWVVSEATKTAATVAGVASRNATEQAGQAEGSAAQAAGAQKSILTSAYEAAAGAYQSASAIPYVGWILGPVAAAAAFIAVEGFGASIPSAAGGFDIPSGMNPLTQLHQNEMVLPANLANAVRGMAANGGGSGGGGFTHNGDINVHVANSNASPEDIAAGVQAAYRSFNPALRNKNRRKR